MKWLILFTKHDFIYKMLYVGDWRKKPETKKIPFGFLPSPLLRYWGRLFSGVRERRKQAGPTLSGRKIWSNGEKEKADSGSDEFLVCRFYFHLWFLKNAFTFGRWCHYAFTVTVSWCYVITREWWFRVHFIHAENFLLSTKSNLTHIAPWSEDDLRQLLNCGQWFLFLKETKSPCGKKN